MSQALPTVTYTLRLTENLKSRLERSACNRNLSLNQLILEIIDRHYQAAGFAQGSTIMVHGRPLEIRVKHVTSHPPGMPMCFFYLDDPSRERELACYSFGFSTQFMRQLNIIENTPYEAIAELGMALLHYYSRNGYDITRLEWCQLPTVTNRRILQVQDTKTTTGAYIRSLEQFMTALLEGLWVDRARSMPQRTIDLDGKTLEERLIECLKDEELPVDTIIEFEPSKSRLTVEEAIEEAVAKARERNCIYRFECNNFVMLIDTNSDTSTLINKYWEFKHNEGIANGTIATATFKYPI